MHRWSHRLDLAHFVRSALGLALASAASLCSAQVVLDGTLGPAGALAGPDFAIGAHLGRQMGSNLFHSFSTFNIGTGQSAVFTGPASVQNIMARVTGGTASTIDGRLRSEISAANLYLLNPAGVVFGPNATLDVSGSFHASTADYLRLADGGRFAASAPATSVLSVAPPAAFGFLSSTPGRIELNGTRLTSAPGETLSLIGGDILARSSASQAGHGTRLTARGGSLNVVSVGSPGEVVPGAPDLGTADFARLGAVDLLSDTTLDVAAAQDAGRIVIRGDRVNVSGARLDAWSYGDGRGGEINIAARDTLTIGGSASDTAGHTFPSRLLTVTQGALDGGGITLSADTLVVTDQALLQSTTLGAGGSGPVAISARDVTVKGAALVNSDTRGSGRAGDVVIEASGMLSVTGAARIQNVSSGAGNAGDITFTAEHISVDGESAVQNQALAGGDAGALTASADSITLEGASRMLGHTHGAGRGAPISLNAREVSIRDGSWVGADTSGEGRGGDVTINAREHLTIEASHVTASRHAGGEGGRIALEAGAFVLDRGAQVSAVALPGSTARGGDIDVDAQTVLLAGGSAILSRSDSAQGAGRIGIRAPDVAIIGGAGMHVQSAGDGAGAPLVIETARLTLQDGGWVASESGRVENGVVHAGRGDGGPIIVTASEAVVAAGATSGLVTVTRGEGNAGALHVVTPSLTLADSAAIVSHTAGGGSGGAIALEAGALSLAGGSIENSSAPTSAGGGATGSTGTISIIAAGTATLTGSARVSSHTLGAGNGGRIHIAADVLELRDDAFISSQSFASGSAGPIEIDVRLLAASGIGGTPAIGTRAYASGRAGDITIAASEALTLSDAGIQSATRGSGDAGNITIVAPVMLVSGGAVETLTLAAGHAGTVAVMSERLELASGARLASASGGMNTDTGEIEVGAGAAGDVIVDASESVSMRGQGASGHASGLYSQTLGTGAPGRVLVTTPQLVLLEGARISAGTADRGDIGTVELDVQSLSLAGASAIVGAGALIIFIDGGSGSGITIEATLNATMMDALLAMGPPPEGSSSPGMLTLTANTIVIFKDDALAWSSAAHGDPATTTLATSDATISATASSASAVSALAVAAGNIVLSAPRAVHPRDDAVTAVLTEHAHVPLITLGHAVVTLPAGPALPAADAIASPDITPAPVTPLPAPDPIPDGGTVGGLDASGSSPERLPSNLTRFSVFGLELPHTRASVELEGGAAQFLDASRLLAQACGAREAHGNQSSFVVRGQGGLPRQPGEGLLASFLDLESDRSWPATRNSAMPTLALKCGRS
jgi:filamentous hemagglutinin family protein